MDEQPVVRRYIADLRLPGGELLRAKDYIIDLNDAVNWCDQTHQQIDKRAFPRRIDGSPRRPRLSLGQPEDY